MRAVEGPFLTTPCKQLHQSSGKTLKKISTENTIIVEVSISELCQIVRDRAGILGGRSLQDRTSLFNYNYNRF